jgi:hypothetical protein
MIRSRATSFEHREDLLVASRLIRLGGFAAMLAGLVFLVDEILNLSNPIPYLDLAFIFAMLLVSVGMVGFHTLQKGSYGLLGEVGFYAVLVGILAQVVGLALLLAGSTALLWLVSVATLGVLVGFVLYGGATLQAGVLPYWCGVAFVVAFPVAVLLGVYAYFWLGIVWLALGYVLWTRRGEASEQPSRVR